jgi:aldehyde:ferredoxin oxidoreductase
VITSLYRGLELRFGDPDLVIQLLEMIAKREGFGDLLAEGVTARRQMEGLRPAYHLAVKGLELPMHDPRVKVGGLGLCHLPYGPDLMNAPHDTLFLMKISIPFNPSNPWGFTRQCIRHGSPMKK